MASIHVYDLPAAAGTDLGVTDWLEIDQSRIDQFADATDDHQWIHCDPERAADGPFGATIAHGFLTLSLLAGFLENLFRIEGAPMTVNYGLDKVRFPSAVRVGSRVRARGEVTDVTEGAAGTRVTLGLVVEVEGEDKPACVAQMLVHVPSAGGAR
ncbi:MaoC family dehydratase [Dietzia kunjamensis]|uniref:MaoC family dehydratase n=1 Tax=Dietzia kunjamensis TaxID=322509 RepID=UPI0033665A8A